MKEFSIKGEHGNLRGAKWLQATNPHSTVQIIHGLAEHHKRYDLTAKALNDEGFQVYCNDHLGHGLHVKDGKLRGYLDKSDGFDKVVDQIIELNSFIRKEHPAKKHFLLAHSLGTVICLAVLRKNIHFDGIILSAAFSRNNIEMFLNNLVLWPEYKLSDPKKINSTMEEFTTKKHNSFFKPNRTTHDYISSDNENVDEYIEDDLCGFPMTNQFWMDLKNGCTNLWKKDTYKKFNKKIPFFFITGSFDTVNNMGKQAFDMHQKFLELGFSTKFKAYEKSRHEPLSDVEKETVWKDVSDFFKANL